jgi:JmjC domain, hydroxylase
MADLDGIKEKLDRLILSNPEQQRFILTVLEILVKDPVQIKNLVSKVQEPTSSLYLVNRSLSQNERTPTEFPIDVAQLESGSADDILRGYRVFQITLPALKPGDSKIWRGSVRHQVLSQRNGLYYIHDDNEAPSQLDDENAFEMPCIPSPDFFKKLDLFTSVELEEFVEKLLQNRAASSQASKYLIAAAHDLNSRNRLGLPDLSIKPDNYLLRTHRHYPGVHSTYGYISSGETFAENHREDFGLPSISVMYAGTPKIWIIAAPHEKERLEAVLAEHQGIPAKCSQFVRHCHVVVPPSFFRR